MMSKLSESDGIDYHDTVPLPDLVCQGTLNYSITFACMYR